MSNYRRLYVPGGTYFFTVNLADRGSRLLVEQVEVLRAAYGAVAAERPFRTNAIVVMPDHIHAVWTLPEGDADYSTRWGAIKARFTMGLRRAGFSPPSELPVVRSGRYAGLKPGLRVDRRERGVWQRRFWGERRSAAGGETSSGRFEVRTGGAPVRDEADFAACVRYCHFNPVKHGYVERPEDWPYSSVHRETREGRWEYA